ncbi:hypothetical protein [Nocardia aurea]|uniref:hypothetical protein n=1 Tax=Nocardia aurea TaxID=2144174 RepID=UPI00339DF2FE
MPAVLPLIPADFGTEHRDVDFSSVAAAPSVWAGFAVEVMLAAREVGRAVEFSAESLPVEVGTDLQAAASYRRRIGIQDVTGQKHRVGAYVNVTTGDPDQLAAAAYVFGSVGVGLRIPDHAVEDFDAGRALTDRRGVPPILGGLYVPVVGRASGNFLAVMSGKVVEFTPGFYRRYCDETICYFSEEIMTAPTAPPGFDRAQLLIDLQAFTRR